MQNDRISKFFHGRILSFKLTCGAWIAKDSGHVVRAKDIIESGPDSYSLHIEISRGVMVRDIRDCDGKRNTCRWQLTEVACVGDAASILFPGTVLTLGVNLWQRDKIRNRPFSVFSNSMRKGDTMIFPV